MVDEVYDIPANIEELFSDVNGAGGEFNYSIVNYNEGMGMDNIESLRYFIDCVNIHEDYIEEDYGTQIILNHPDFCKKICIDSGGMGDFFSHSYSCTWVE